jgi:hypothetical protein
MVSLANFVLQGVYSLRRVFCLLIGILLAQFCLLILSALYPGQHFIRASTLSVEVC